MLRQSKFLDITLQYLYSQHTHSLASAYIVYLIGYLVEQIHSLESPPIPCPTEREWMLKCSSDRLIVVNGPTSSREQERNRNRHWTTIIQNTHNAFSFSFVSLPSSFALFRLSFWFLTCFYRFRRASGVGKVSQSNQIAQRIDQSFAQNSRFSAPLNGQTIDY